MTRTIRGGQQKVINGYSMLSVLGLLVVAHAILGILVVNGTIDMPSDSKVALTSILFGIAALLLIIVLYFFFGQDKRLPDDYIQIPKSLLD
jgi:hypothetical protein